MSENKPTFYITSPIFYPNGVPHLGHAYTLVVCDILARYHKILGEPTYFLTGLDENTGKILKVAADKKLTIQAFLDGITTNFTDLYKRIDVSYDQFVHTTDQTVHWPGATKMWNSLVASGDIYKAKYTGLYCLGCETFYTEKDLVDGKCPIHLTVPEKIEEDNYFFKLKKYTGIIKEKIENNEFKIVPTSRRNEILALLERGLEDVSFSRPIKAVPHGIPVPSDPEQVIYVWCDALVNYISALGYGREDESLFKTFWPGVHLIGKDILRFHTAIWPAMLISAGLPLPKTIVVHGLITSGGHKMSKSLGNIIDPNDVIREYGSEALRYFLARDINVFEDSDLTMERLKISYNEGLANGLGNLVSRVMKMANSYEVTFNEKISVEHEFTSETDLFVKKYNESFEKFDIKSAIDAVWGIISWSDRSIQSKQPFKVFKINKEEARNIVFFLLYDLFIIAKLLKPFMPETSEKIKDLIIHNKMPETPLFVRKD